MRKALLTALIVVLLPTIGVGWGNEGHLLINKIALQKMPEAMPAFFRESRDLIIYLGLEPDRWRGASEYTLKSSQEPDHFINLEKIAALGALPSNRYAFYRVLYEKRANDPEDPDYWLPESIGLLPYITIEVYERLKGAFREYRALKSYGRPTDTIEKVIVFYAGWMSHYVADGANTLHVTVHYRGWVGENPQGYSTDRSIHFDFEGRVVSRFSDLAGIESMISQPARIDKPFDAFLEYLNRSNGMVEKLYQLYKGRAFVGEGTKEGREFVNERLSAGVQMLISLWHTAWVESEQMAK